MKSLTGPACPNKRCSSKTGSPELAVSGIWFAELTQPKGNKSCHVDSEQRKIWSAVLTEANLQRGRVEGGRSARTGSSWAPETPVLLRFFGLTLDP